MLSNGLPLKPPRFLAVGVGGVLCGFLGRALPHDVWLLRKHITKAERPFDIRHWFIVEEDRSKLRLLSSLLLSFT